MSDEPAIEFFTLYEDDFDAIAPPVPARKVIPEWFRNLPPVIPEAMSAQTSGQTVKACPAFFDAMAEGWIVCTPADLWVELFDNGRGVNVGSPYPRNLASTHYGHQIKGSPDEARAIVKFHSMWCVRTSPGISCLMLPPLNRHADFSVFSGIIDTDTFHQQIAPPAVFTRGDGNFTIPKGTPLAQVIPFRREDFTAVIRPPDRHRGEGDNNLQQRQSLSEAGHYRRHLRAKR